MTELARALIISGVVLFLGGVLLFFAGKGPGFGKLPGDIFIQKGPVSFYFPLATSLIISLVLSFLLMLWSKK